MLGWSSCACSAEIGIISGTEGSWSATGTASSKRSTMHCSCMHATLRWSRSSRRHTGAQSPVVQQMGPVVARRTVTRVTRRQNIVSRSCDPVPSSKRNVTRHTAMVYPRSASRAHKTRWKRSSGEGSAHNTIYSHRKEDGERAVRERAFAAQTT